MPPILESAEDLDRQFYAVLDAVRAAIEPLDLDGFERRWRRASEQDRRVYFNDLRSHILIVSCHLIRATRWHPEASEGGDLVEESTD
jgi:hypothetical protein